jgi:hypothetical protein
VKQAEVELGHAADHFSWTRVLVKRVLTYAKAFPEKISNSREGETDAVPAAG